jgi:hypothetical protein
MMAEIVAAEFFRYGPSLKLDRQIYNNHSPGNAAVEAALQDHDVLDLSHFGPADPNDWPCQELSLSTGKSSQSERKDKVEATGRGDDSQVQLHAKFVNPAGSAMRGQAQQNGDSIEHSENTKSFREARSARGSKRPEGRSTDDRRVGRRSRFGAGTRTVLLAVPDLTLVVGNEHRRRIAGTKAQR